jgi:hypothetical protein
MVSSTRNWRTSSANISLVRSRCAHARPTARSGVGTAPKMSRTAASSKSTCLNQSSMVWCVVMKSSSWLDGVSGRCDASSCGSIK